MKTSDIEFLLDIAKLAASRSKAIRLKVGGVVADSSGNFVAYAYNGTPHNFDNCCENKLTDTDGNSVLVTKDTVIHCEANLIAHAARRGISINGGSVFLTHSPCEHCAALLYQSGIKTVYFIEKFRTYDTMFHNFHTFMEFYQIN